MIFAMFNFVSQNIAKNLHKTKNNSMLSALPFWRFILNEAWRRYLMHWCCTDVSSTGVCHSRSAGLVKLAEGQTVDRRTFESWVSFVCWNTGVLTSP